MAESQAHGFKIERMLRACSEFGGAITPSNYSSEFDVPAGLSAWSQGAPVQIKTTLGSQVMLGDALRNFNRDVPFELLIVCGYQHSASVKIFDRIERFLFEPLEWRSLFGTLPLEDLFTLDAFIRSIPKGSQEALRAEAHARKQKLIDKHAPIVSLQPKIDSKSQRRLQSGASLESFPLILGKPSRHKEYRSGDAFGDLTLPLTIQSSPRQRSR